MTAAFERFHRDNPRVYEGLVSLARRLKSNGRRAYGMKSLFEVMRWHQAIQTTGDVVKLNNNHTSQYARLIMDRETDLRGFFATRGDA